MIVIRTLGVTGHEEKTMPKEKALSSAPVHAVVSTRFVWVFEVMDGPGAHEKPWQFVKYIATEYGTDHCSRARETAEREYGVTIRGSQRRELTFEEYCAVLRCNIDSPHGQRVYQAMLRIVFTGSLSLC